MTYPEIKASQFPFLFPIDSLFFSFFPYRGSFLRRFPILSPAYQSHTSLSILVSYRLIRSSFFSRKNTFFSLESHSPPALSVAPTNCEQGSLHLLNIIRNIQFLNYARILSEYYQIIIRILSAAPAHFDHEYLHLLNIIHTIQFQNY